MTPGRFSTFGIKCNFNYIIKHTPIFSKNTFSISIHFLCHILKDVDFLTNNTIFEFSNTFLKKLLFSYFFSCSTLKNAQFPPDDTLLDIFFEILNS